mmetsp:Transcript_15629/g.27145  ORF Transcript_15629/g.27145 Transcript_15629/m.27145 type:complete len:368 (-) Transcript_15629:129-1232(-)
MMTPVVEKATTTKDIQRDQEKQLRTKDVKERLGPLVDRLKDSISKIDMIEASLDGAEDSSSILSNKIHSVDSNRQRQSRRELMHQSMEMVKIKMLRLKRMEETLTASEDRRHVLQHQVLQVSLSEHQQIGGFERDASLREEKRRLEDDLDARNSMLLRKTRECQQLQEELKQTKEEKEKLKEALVQRQAKMNEHALKCGGLECQVENLNNLCKELMANLKVQEDRNVCLEQELLEVRKFARRDAGSPRGAQPRTIQFQESKESISTSCLTESTTEEEDHMFDNDSNSSMDSSYTTMQAGFQNHLNSDGSSCVRLQLGHPEIIHEDHQESAPLLQTLMAKFEALNRENAELRGSRQLASGKRDILSRK